MFENSVFQPLNVWELILFATIQLGQAMIFVGVTVVIKKIIRWSKINTERFLGGYFLVFVALTFIALVFDSFLIIYAWIFGSLVGYGVALAIFNSFNENTKRSWFVKTDIPHAESWLKSYITYRDSDDQRVAISIDENGREPFKKMFWRIFGRKRRIKILNNGSPFRCNIHDELFFYDEFYMHKTTGDYGYRVEPNKNLGDAAFLKGYDRHYSNATELELRDQQIARLHMELNLLASKKSRFYCDPIFKHVYGRYYKEWTRLKEWLDAEDDEEIRRIRKEEQKAIEKQEKDVSEQYRRIDENNEMPLDEWEYKQ